LSDAASTDSDEFSGPAADWHPHLAAYISARGLWPDYGLRQHDFGQVNQTLVTDGIHDWIGRHAPPAKSKPSTFEYTDDERALRDNAYPLIEPPYRQQWYSVAGEYGLIKFDLADHRKYFDRLMEECHRSPSAVYARLLTTFATIPPVLRSSSKLPGASSISIRNARRVWFISQR
jgi:hypothetical protein